MLEDNYNCHIHKKINHMCNCALLQSEKIVLAYTIIPNRQHCDSIEHSKIYYYNLVFL